MLGIDIHDGVPLRFGQFRGISFENHGSDVFHPFQETHAEPLVRQFLLSAHCPESVPQVVVFDAAVLLDLAVSAVMVGEKQSFRRNDFCLTL